MGKTFIRRLGAVVLLSILPSAVLLAVVAARGAISYLWLAVALGLGLAGGALMCALVVRLLIDRAQVLDQAARDLEAKRPPRHLIRSESFVGDAEQHLLAAGDALVGEVEALAEQRDELEAILRGMSEGVLVTGAHGELLMMNGTARELLALSPEVDYRGLSLVEICREPALLQLIQRSMTDVRALDAEVATSPAGVRHLRLTASPIRAAGRRASRVLLLYDITQLRAYENLRSDFIANLTHEIRTPLSAICGYAETLLAGVDNEATRHRFLAIVERQARRLARLVEDLVSLSDLERGLTPLDFKALDPRRLIDEAAELMQEQAARQEVTMRVDCPADLGPLMGDHDRLEQVLVNLLDNAIKYTPAGGLVTVAVRPVKKDNEAGQAVELAVSDTGEGVPPQHLARLTERFYRVDQARSRELGGTGLGLAIVKHIVQLHHGELAIESKIREGTTVTVRLPLHQPAGDSAPTAVARQ